MTAPDIRYEFCDDVAVVACGGSGIGRAIAVRWVAAQAGGKAIYRDPTKGASA
jgi:NAD(P)-dependent dehydrogenase (short-subunit alcohol dehydrogenase family)